LEVLIFRDLFNSFENNRYDIIWLAVLIKFRWLVFQNIFESKRLLATMTVKKQRKDFVEKRSRTLNDSVVDDFVFFSPKNSIDILQDRKSKKFKAIKVFVLFRWMW